jgi:PAS domain S-box-containing protein
MVELQTDLKSILERELESCPTLRSALGDNVLLRQELSRRLEELETIRAALVRAEAHTRAIIDAAQEGVVLFDTKGIVQEFNPQASAIFGWSPQEVVGRNLADFAVPPRLHHVFAKHLESAFRQGRDPLHDFMEVYALRRNGEEFALEISTSVIETPRGKFLSTFCRDITERKRAEMALHESESRLQAIFNSVEAGIFVIDPETHCIVDANPPALKMVGLPDERVIGVECHKFICPADKGRCPVTDLSLTVDNSEHILLTGEGKERAIIKTVRPVVIAGRKLLLESFVDISDRKRAESALKERTSYLNTLIEISPLGIAVLDTEERIQMSNPAFERLFLYSGQELQGANLDELIVPTEMLSEAKELAQRCLMGMNVHVTSRRRRKDGAGVEVEIYGVPLVMECKPKGLLALYQDVTERKRAERALHESEERYRLLFETNLAGVYRTTRGGRSLHCNQALANMLGYNSPQEVLAHPVLDFYFTDQERLKFLGELNKAGGLSNFEMRLRRKDGTPLWALASVNPVADEAGDAQVIQGTLVDITERKCAEAAMAERHRLASLLAEVGSALTGPESLRQGLQRCAEILVRDIGAAFARVWTVNEKDQVLELQASAGLYTHIDGGHARVPMGKFKIGRIAENGEPHLTNTVLEDSWVGDPEWARREGMVSFAGYPLKVEEKVLGVAAAFARQPLSDATLQAFASVSHSIAQFIERKRAEKALQESEERYRVLFERNLAGVFRATLYGRRILDCNDAYAHILGYNSREEVLEHGRLHDFFDPAERETARARVIEEKRVTNFEVCLCRKDRSPVWTLENVSLIEGNEGNQPLIEGTLIDISKRKKAEEALRESAERYRLLFERNLAGVFRATLFSRRILDCNDAYARILGYDSRQEVLAGGKAHEFYNPADLDTARANLLEKKGLTNSEICLRRRDQSLVWAVSTVSLIDGGDEHDPLFEGTLIDITERKQAEAELLKYAQDLEVAKAAQERHAEELARLVEELARERELLRALMDNIPDHIYFKDRQSGFLRVNASVARMFGLSEPGQLVGKTDFDFFTQDHAQQAFDDEQEVVATGKPMIAKEERETWPDGRVTWVSTTKMPLRDANGTIVGTFGVSHDITERKRAEEAIRASEERYRELFENASDLVFTTDLKGGLTSLNQVAAKTIGYSREEATGMNLRQLVDRRQWRLVDETRERLLAGDSAMSVELEVRTKDGRRVILEVKPGLIYKDGKPVAMQGIGRDITGREAAEMELRQAQKLESVGRLASGIAHEINTPIQFVGDNTRFLQDSFAGLQTLLAKYQELRDAATAGAVSPGLLDELRGTEEQSDCAYLLEEIPKALTQTLEGVTQVATIVRAMKEFAHPERKERVAADINKALLNTLTVARNELKYVADVETEFGDLPLVVCNISDLNQVFLNLLVNAAHAIGDVVKQSGKKGKIRVRTAAEGKTVLVAISDTGCGIPEGIRNRIFDPFFTTKEVGRGTGQGLAIARSVVVERHKGSLSFESVLGEGTTFYVRLPIQSGDSSESG